MLTFKPLTPDYASQTAKIHISGISTGFISSLGIDFVTALYEAISSDRNSNSFGFVAVEGGEVVGFIAVSSNLSALYKFIVHQNFFRFGFVLARRMFSLKVIKKVFANILYPSKMKKAGLPDAELLSIVVEPSCRGKGVARKLIDQCFEECKSRGIDKLKVLVAAENKAANKLYMNSGFLFHSSIDSHGVNSNIYVIDFTS